MKQEHLYKNNMHIYKIIIKILNLNLGEWCPVHVFNQGMNFEQKWKERSVFNVHVQKWKDMANHWLMVHKRLEGQFLNRNPEKRGI